MKIIKQFFFILGRLSYMVLFMNIPKLIYGAKSYFYTGFLSHKFYKFGKGGCVDYPMKALCGAKYISIGDNTLIGRNAQIRAIDSYMDTSYNPRIEIGQNCVIRDNVHISAIEGVFIGDNLLTGDNIYISDNNHGAFNNEVLECHPKNRPLETKGPVVIGNNVWIGNNVCILSGVRIGDKCVIGANSVVTKSIDSNSIAAGCPAKVIKHL